MPKVSSKIDKSILNKVLSADGNIGLFVNSTSNQKIFYRTTGGLYWKVFTDFSPLFYCNGIKGKSSRETFISVNTQEEATILVGVLSSSLFWWWYTITSNLRDSSNPQLNFQQLSNNFLSFMRVLCLSFVLL